MLPVAYVANWIFGLHYSYLDLPPCRSFIVDEVYLLSFHGRNINWGRFIWGLLFSTVYPGSDIYVNIFFFDLRHHENSENLVFKNLLLSYLKYIYFFLQKPPLKNLHFDIFFGQGTGLKNSSFTGVLAFKDTGLCSGVSFSTFTLHGPRCWNSASALHPWCRGLPHSHAAVIAAIHGYLLGIPFYVSSVFRSVFQWMNK